MNATQHAKTANGKAVEELDVLVVPSPKTKVDGDALASPKNTVPSLIGPREMRGVSVCAFIPDTSISVDCTATISPAGLVALAIRQVRGRTFGLH